MYQSSIQVKKKERKIGMFLGKIRNPTFNNNDSSVLIFLRIKKKKKRKEKELFVSSGNWEINYNLFDNEIEKLLKK